MTWRCKEPRHLKGGQKCDLARGHAGPCHYTMGHGTGRGKRVRTIHLAADLDAELVRLAQERHTSVSKVVVSLLTLAMGDGANDNADHDRACPPERPAI